VSHPRPLKISSAASQKRTPIRLVATKAHEAELIRALEHWTGSRPERKNRAGPQGIRHQLRWQRRGRATAGSSREHAPLRGHSGDGDAAALDKVNVGPREQIPHCIGHEDVATLGTQRDPASDVDGRTA